MNPAVGIVKMPQKQFTTISIIGSVVWAGGVTLIGALVGHSVKGIDKYILPVVLVIIIGTGLPVYKELYSAHKASRLRKKSADES
jgi:membrane-associated protein